METELNRQAAQREKKIRKPSTKKRKPTVRATDFVKAWVASPSVIAVCETTGMSDSSVRARAADYRKRGVKLPEIYGEVSIKFSVDALNKLIDKLVSEDETK